ncbi:MAG TPA: AMP-binding protein, partial [Microthrixaceae bacterium]|nr:AMP-binding protein [Microthrixaceae bacterium]
LANALLGAGVGSGDVVLWLGQNSHRVIECLLAAAKVGAVCCVANWRQSTDELAFLLDDVDAAVVVWQEGEVGETVRAARARFAQIDAADRAIWLQHDAPISNQTSYEAFLASGAAEDPDLDVDAGAPVLMLYTAAFTGTPNGAMLSHDAVLVQSLMMANLQRIDPSYVYLNSGPLFHVATFMTTLATLLFGGTNVFTPRVDAEELCRVIDAERCTGAFIMPPTIDQILELNAPGDDGARRFDLSSLRSFRGAKEWNEMITIDDSPWATRPAGFGQTEVMGMLTFNALGGGGSGNSGRPSPLVSVRILDPDGHEVPTGETGEICARGPQVMVGYRNRLEENERRQRGGYHHTNDLGRREPDGSVSFVGPKGRLIKSAAENIYPAEVEAALNAHDAVRESAVIGVADPTWGQSVRAIVVLHDGASAAEDELVEFVKGRIASYKKPKSVVFREAPLPRFGWPIDYDTLDAEYGGGGYPGEG